MPYATDLMELSIRSVTFYMAHVCLIMRRNKCNHKTN